MRQEARGLSVIYVCMFSFFFFWNINDSIFFVFLRKFHRDVDFLVHFNPNSRLVKECLTLASSHFFLRLILAHVYSGIAGNCKADGFVKKIGNKSVLHWSLAS